MLGFSTMVTLRLNEARLPCSTTGKPVVWKISEGWKVEDEKQNNVKINNVKLNNTNRLDNKNFIWV